MFSSLSIASLVYDALAGLGCMAVSLALSAAAGFGAALWLGLFPGVSAALKRLGKERSDDAES